VEPTGRALAPSSRNARNPGFVVVPAPGAGWHVSGNRDRREHADDEDLGTAQQPDISEERN
jgi:hypothetical protein